MPTDTDTTSHDDRPATRKDLRLLATELRGEMAVLAAELRGEMAVLAAELRKEMHAMRADLVDVIESRTRALFFSQIASILAVAAIAFAD